MMELNNVKIESVKIGDTVFKECTEDDEKKVKKYQFDSLVYRYIRARENMARYEYVIDSNSPKCKNVDFVEYQKQAQRDILRFIEILNDTIGEHS